MKRLNTFDVFRRTALLTRNPLLMEFYASEQANVGRSHPAEVLRPRKCDCHVIGGATLGAAGIGTSDLAARIKSVQLDAGDADSFKPYYLFITAYQASGTAATTQIQGDPLPMLMLESKVGQNSNLRRANSTDPSYGIVTTCYGEDKELECLDWYKFTSITNQGLALTLYNPNDVTVHAFVNLWGIIE